MYFLGISGWFLVASRFVAGIGSGVISSLFADISRITTVEERTAVMSSFMAVRQFGLLVGKCCHLPSRHHLPVGHLTIFLSHLAQNNILLRCCYTFARE